MNYGTKGKNFNRFEDDPDNRITNNLRRNLAAAKAEHDQKQCAKCYKRSRRVVKYVEKKLKNGKKIHDQLIKRAEQGAPSLSLTEWKVEWLCPLHGLTVDEERMTLQMARERLLLPMQDKYGTSFNLDIKWSQTLFGPMLALYLVWTPRDPE